MRPRTLALATLVLASCYDPPPVRPGCAVLSYIPDQVHYTIDHTVTLSDGLRVDAPDPYAAQAVVNKLAACLEPVTGGRLPDYAQGWCPPAFPPLNRNCLTVAVRPAVPSCTGPWELLPDLAPAASCLAKGVTPTAQCPCRWRSGVQDYQTAVTTPDLGTLTDPLTRIATGCWFPWNVPELVKCMQQ